MGAMEANAEELAANLDFMRGKLEESRAGMADADIVIPYDNGGGQIGIRRNPAFDAYESLMKTYLSTLKEYREHVGEDVKSKPSLVKFESFAKTMQAGADA